MFPVKCRMSITNPTSHCIKGKQNSTTFDGCQGENSHHPLAINANASRFTSISEKHETNVHHASADDRPSDQLFRSSHRRLERAVLLDPSLGSPQFYSHIHGVFPGFGVLAWLRDLVLCCFLVHFTDHPRPRTARPSSKT